MYTSNKNFALKSPRQFVNNRSLDDPGPHVLYAESNVGPRTTDTAEHQAVFEPIQTMKKLRPRTYINSGPSHL
ncbi:hypothetical protein DPSP01_011295 [Paraphaeosphaeria sporulosa]